MCLICSIDLGPLAVTAVGVPATVLADSTPPAATANYHDDTSRVRFSRTDLSEPGEAAALSPTIHQSENSK